jgi:hypothetical protein
MSSIQDETWISTNLLGVAQQMATADIDVSQYKKEYNIDCKQAHNFLEE